MALGMTPATEQKMEALEVQCLDVLQKAFKDEVTNDVVKQAKDVLAIMAKNRQTTNARDAFRFHMVDSFASPADKARYVKATCPEVKKLLSV